MGDLLNNKKLKKRMRHEATKTTIQNTQTNGRISPTCKTSVHHRPALSLGTCHSVCLMNSARLKNSKRLQRVRNLLATGREYSTMDIIHKANVCAVNSIISELRENGIYIICRRKAGAFYYQMTGIDTTKQQQVNLQLVSNG